MFDLALVFFPAAYYGSKGMDPVRELGLKPRNFWVEAGATLLLFVALVAVSLALSWALAYFRVNDLEKVASTVAGVSLARPLFFYYLLSVRVVAEEVFFRGFLAKRFGSLASSAAFALAHVFYGSAAEVIGAFVLGVLLAEAYRRNKSLTPNIFAHVLYNLAILRLLFGF